MHRTLLTLLLTLATLAASSQTQRNALYDSYIERYRSIAVAQMREHGIPASVTLAQGLLESGAGTSDLARKSNNHFGIKRGSDWTGPTVRRDDDRRGEQFRAYASVQDSYEDHSRFLLRERYQRLFRLSTLDYKGWARGLKACGYATNPAYADRLIALIELYHLNDLDEDPNAPFRLPELPTLADVKLQYRNITTNNNIQCVTVRSGDTWQSLAQELKIPLKKLLQYNEAVLDVPLHEGDYVYMQKKAKRGPKSMKHKWHTIAAGESMYTIAQKYGMQLSRLYKLNFKTIDYTPIAGDLLRVR